MRSNASSIDVDADVVLVPRSTADSAEMFAIVEAHRTDLREWLGWVDATHTLGDIRRYAFFVERQFEQRAGFDYAIRLRGELAGSAGLHDVDWMTRGAQIGYWLAPAVRGQGVMTRAVSALCTHGFTTLGFHRLEIRCVTENRNSRAVAERLGFALEGILKESYVLNGRYRDLALYAMTASQWQQRQPARA